MFKRKLRKYQVIFSDREPIMVEGYDLTYMQPPYDNIEQPELWIAGCRESNEVAVFIGKNVLGAFEVK